jgi:hypothetical protein
MRMSLITFCCLLSCIQMLTQNNQQEINAIKKSKHYVYAMAVSAQSKADAELRAKDLLLLEVEQWLKDEKEEGYAGYVVKVKNNTSQIETQRGKLYRVFAYVAKRDVLPYNEGEEIETVWKDSIKDSVQAAPQNDAPAVEPEAEQPEVQSVTLTAAEKRMLEIMKFSELNSYLAEQKAGGYIVDCGKYVTMPKDADMYIFVYDKQGDIRAKIKKSGTRAINMSTLQEDDVTNYKGCGAIWIRIKE